MIDFVDNSLRYNHALNLHRAAGVSRYRPGGFVLAPADLMETDEQAIQRGERPTVVIDIGLWAKDYQEIDIFSWQEAVANMISVSDLEVELAAAEGTVRRAVERDQLKPDHTVNLGDRTYHYFSRDRIEEVRTALGLPKVEQETIKNLFLQYADDKMDMSASYKPVMLLAILDAVDSHGRAPCRRCGEISWLLRDSKGSRPAGGTPDRSTRETGAPGRRGSSARDAGHAFREVLAAALTCATIAIWHSCVSSRIFGAS